MGTRKRRKRPHKTMRCHERVWRHGRLIQCGNKAELIIGVSWPFGEVLEKFSCIFHGKRNGYLVPLPGTPRGSIVWEPASRVTYVERDH